VGVIELQEFNGPRETDGDDNNPQSRTDVKNECETQKYDERPKRVSAVFGEEIREGKKTRSPQQASPDN
jgi:hypothetical protein